MDEKTIRQCPVCENEYSADPKRLKHGRQTTCSRDCSYKLRARDRRKPKSVKPCSICGTMHERRDETEYDAVYCSQDCAHTGRRLGLTPRIVTKPYKNTTHRKRMPKDCKQCGKTMEVIPALIERKNYCSRDCLAKHQSEVWKGKGNPSWIDGRSYRKKCYRGDNWEVARKACYERDNYECQFCGVKCVIRRDARKRDGKRIIQCHHVEDYRINQDNSLENLRTVCASCHGSITMGKGMAWLAR